MVARRPGARWLGNNSDGDEISQDFTFAQHDIALMLARFKQIESAAQEWPGPAPSAD